jgi:hypothetical protein
VLQPTVWPDPLRFLPIPVTTHLLATCAILLASPLDAQGAQNHPRLATAPSTDTRRVGARPMGGWLAGARAGRLGTGRRERGAGANGPRAAPIVLYVDPYVGLPLSDTRIQPAFGAHVEWPVTRMVRFAVRYEWRVNKSEPSYGCTSIDAVRRVAGTDTVALAVTGGWARWQGRDRATFGMRFHGPMATMASGGDAVIELWADVRYVVRSMQDAKRLNGRVWAAAMFVVPLNIAVKRW